VRGSKVRSSLPFSTNYVGRQIVKIAEIEVGQTRHPFDIVVHRPIAEEFSFAQLSGATDANFSCASTAGTAGTFGTFGGCLGSAGTYGSFGCSGS
jgi:hypothetical protein